METSRYLRYKKTYQEYSKNNRAKIRDIRNKQNNLDSFGLYKTTAEILDIIGNNCFVCGISNDEHLNKHNRYLSIHHKDNNGRNSAVKNNRIDNLAPICSSCHMRIHKVYSKSPNGKPSK